MKPDPREPARLSPLEVSDHDLGALGALEPRRRRVCIVGSGTTYLSGISYYTVSLTRALLRHHCVTAILMRRLVPRRFYPGRERVGQPLTTQSASDHVPTFDGVDWFLVPSLYRAARFFLNQSPEVLILQWWTGAVLVPYLVLAALAQRKGAAVVVEFHEDQDTGEAKLPLVAAITRSGLRRLLARADAFVVHSAWDKERLSLLFGIDPADVRVIRHGPYDMRLEQRAIEPPGAIPVPESIQGVDDGPDAMRILFFGTVRPYKGLEDLVEAFERIQRAGDIPCQLVVVGETWEGWELPVDRIRNSPVADRITLVNRYVTDAEVRAHFDDADLVVLPYHRSSASGPLHVAMAHGLPVVVTGVGGLIEAVQHYSGAIVVPPRDPEAIVDGIRRALGLVGQMHHDTYSWEDVADAYDEVINQCRARTAASHGRATGRGDR